MSPAYVQLSLGLYYKKADNFWLNLSPLSARVLLVSGNFTNDLLSGKTYFGVDANKNAKFFLGAAVSGFYKHKL